MRTRLSFGLACLALTAFASAARADEPLVATPTPPPAAEGTHPNIPAVVGGASLLGVSYATGVVGGALMDICLRFNLFGSGPTECPRPHWPMYIPVVGPFVALGTADSAGVLNGDSAAFMIIDGVAQVGSLALLIYGLAARVPAQPKPVTVVPTASSSGYGLAVAGTF
jgi:hypothetical protein